MASPRSGNGQDTDQIIDTALQAPDLVGWLFHLAVLASVRAGHTTAPGHALTRKRLGGTIIRHRHVIPGMAWVARRCAAGPDAETPAAARRTGSRIVSRR